MMGQTVSTDKQALQDLVRLREELDAVIESLQLMQDDAFMQSYTEAKRQVREREFADFDDL